MQATIRYVDGGTCHFRLPPSAEDLPTDAIISSILHVVHGDGEGGPLVEWLRSCALIAARPLSVGSIIQVAGRPAKVVLAP